MFVGHYAASFALKKVEPRASLGTLFLAVQFVDILFFPFVLLGIEKLTIIENYTASTHFRLDYMPYTHSLLATVIWALFAYALFRYVKKTPSKVALVVAIAVASHWFLDLFVHTPDLPVWVDSSYKMGLGLWNNDNLTFAFEAALLLAGLVLYLQATQAKTRSKNSNGDAEGPSFTARYGIILFVAFMLVANAINIFGPLTDDNIVSFALIPLVLYLAFAGIAYFLDSQRVAKHTQ